MKWADRVAGHVGNETVACAALLQRRGLAAHLGDEGAGELTRNLPKPRSLDPNFTDWDPDDIDTWDDRIVVVANEEDFLWWRQDWLEENGPPA